MQRSGNSGAGQASPRAHFDALGSFTKHRKYNHPISTALMNDPDTRDVGRAIANCSLRIKAKVLLGEPIPSSAILEGALLCRKRLCPFCEWRRTKAMRARLHQGLSALYEDQPKLRGVFLTLTVKNVPLQDLGEELERMNKAWARLKKCSFFPTDLWFRRTEVTVGHTLTKKGQLLDPAVSGGGQVMAHPHFHVLLLVKPSYFTRDYVKHSEWQKQWQMALRADYAPVVDVRTAKSKSGKSKTCIDDAKSAVLEAAKYTSKASELMELGPATTELHWQLKGKKLMAMSRPLSQYVKDGDISEEEMLDSSTAVIAEGVPYVDVYADWFEDQQEYVITRVLED